MQPHRGVPPMLTSSFFATLASANLGDLPGALRRLATMERLLADVEDPTYHARAATTGSWLWRELGDLGRARDLATRAALDRMAAALPPELRPGFLERGRLARELGGT